MGLLVNGVARNRPDALEDLYDAVVSVDDDPERRTALRRALADLMNRGEQKQTAGHRVRSVDRLV